MESGRRSSSAHKITFQLLMPFKQENAMNKKLVINLFLCLVITSVLLVGSVVFAKPVVRSDKPASLAKAAVTDLETVDGNRIFNYINNLGAWCTHNNPVGFGMQWPGESGHSVDFASGVWVAGTVGGETRTAAAEFTYEFQPGHILPNGSPSSPDDANAQILKINKADLLDEGTSNPDYDLWINYANSLGAPVMKAVDGSDSLSVNGKRIPALIGHQILWMVFNDPNPAVHGVLFQTSPIGLEVQSTVWTFNRPDEFGDMMFMKFLLVNKGSNDLEDAYIGLWFDIDMGDANDDLVFCDTTLSLDRKSTRLNSS